MEEEEPLDVQALPDIVTNELEDDAAANDEVDSEFSDVPEDIDDAMAWLEQLAAKQGAPLEGIAVDF